MQVACTARSVAWLDGGCSPSESRRVRGSRIVGSRRSVLALGALALWLSACRSAKTTAPATSTSAGLAQAPSRSSVLAHPTDASSSSSATSLGSSLDRGAFHEITAPCVLHAGESHTHRREILKPKGRPGGVVESASCSFNAECVWAPGKTSPGDGNVGVECGKRRCTCIGTLLSTPEIRKIFRFESDVPCSTAEQAQHLLVEHCTTGMKI